MRLSSFRRLGFAAWLVAIALIGNAAAQNQLGLNVLEATTERAAVAEAAVPADPHAHHHTPEQHAAMMAAAPAAAPAHAGHDHNAPGGHTHKGHADCSVCGAVAAMAALTLPATLAFDVPRDFAAPVNILHAEFTRRTARYALYISRAPPLFA